MHGVALPQVGLQVALELLLPKLREPGIALVVCGIEAEIVAVKVAHVRRVDANRNAAQGKFLVLVDDIEPVRPAVAERAANGVKRSASKSSIGAAESQLLLLLMLLFCFAFSALCFCFVLLLFLALRERARNANELINAPSAAPRYSPAHNQVLVLDLVPFQAVKELANGAALAHANDYSRVRVLFDGLDELVVFGLLGVWRHRF